MKVPLSWLREYVDVNVPAKELAHMLTMAGIEVGEVLTIGGWTNCSVASVLHVQPHPNADRLTLCTVDTGAEQVQVVCGAPNVAAGQLIAYAKVGAELFNAHSSKVEALKPAKIRGVVSEGMICSELELGLSDDHAGILVLPEDAPLGMPLSEYMGDEILVLELTPNRSDCMSILGVAHEVAALTGGTVREPDRSYPEGGDPIEDQASVDVADPDLCARYTASLVRGITIGPSPQWLQERLTRAGMRPINNVVDITNYVMLEYNQPLHAFDFSRMKENKVIVRRAKPGEVLVSLDGTDRKLSSDMLVIADARDAVGLAGVMGGANSEMTDATTVVLLESATFNAANNRRTSQALRMPTEASARFEKGLRPELAPLGLARATQLIHQIAGGVVAKGILDIYPGQGTQSNTVTLTMKRLEKVLGLTFPIQRIVDVLGSLGFECEVQGDGSLQAVVPYWRGDISIEDDLVEEVARIVGYDEIPTTMISSPIPSYTRLPLQELREQVKDQLVAYGMQEIITYSLTNLADLTRAKALEDGIQPLKIANPLSSQQEHLRTTLRGNVLSTLAANLAHETGPVAVFESGHVYLPRNEDLPLEKEMVTAVFSGPRWEAHWLAREERLGFLDAKGVLERLMEGLGLVATFRPSQDVLLKPGACAEVMVGTTPVGVIGDVHPSIVESYDIEPGPVALFDLDVEALLNAIPPVGRSYKSIPRFPVAVRDLSIVLDLNIPAAQVQALMENHRLVDKVQLFDVYEGQNIPDGKRSLAYHIYFQANDRTLTANEVGKSLDAILKSLNKDVGAELRV